MRRRDFPMRFLDEEGDGRLLGHWVRAGRFRTRWMVRLLGGVLWVLGVLCAVAGFASVAALGFLGRVVPGPLPAVWECRWRGVAVSWCIEGVPVAVIGVLFLAFTYNTHLVQYLRVQAWCWRVFWVSAACVLVLAVMLFVQRGGVLYALCAVPGLLPLLFWLKVGAKAVRNDG